MFSRRSALCLELSLLTDSVSGSKGGSYTTTSSRYYYYNQEKLESILIVDRDKS